MQKLNFHSFPMKKKSFQYLGLMLFSLTFFYSYPAFADDDCSVNSLKVTLNGDIQCLDYQLEYGKITNFEYVSDLPSIVIDVTSDQEGVMSMIIPNSVLGLKTSDDKVIVKYNDVESNYLEEIITDKNRNILFFIPPGETKLSILGQSSTSGCNVSEIPVLDKCIPYNILNGVIIDAIANTSDNSIVIQINASEDGILAINPTKSTIDGIFMVLVDGEEWDDVEYDGNKVTVMFPVGAEEITIIGTFVIPEFGVMTMTILALSITSLIILSIKSKILFLANKI